MVKKKLIDKRAELNALSMDQMIVRESMFRAYNHLDYICRKLKNQESIQDTWFFNGRLWLVCLNGKKEQIFHRSDLVRLFGAEIVDGISKEQ